MLCHAISDSTEQGRGRVPATTSCRHQKTTLQMSRDRENTGIPASAGVEMTERNIDRPGCFSPYPRRTETEGRGQRTRQRGWQVPAGRKGSITAWGSRPRRVKDGAASSPGRGGCCLNLP